MRQDYDDWGNASSPSFFTLVGGDGGPADLPGQCRGSGGGRCWQGGSNRGGRQHHVIEVKKEGDDASPPSLSALGREGCSGGWIIQDNLQQFNNQPRERKGKKKAANALVTMMAMRIICHANLPTMSQLFGVGVPGVGAGSNLRFDNNHNRQRRQEGPACGGSGEVGVGCNVRTTVIIPVG
jgi:hypothetical protein